MLVKGPLEFTHLINAQPRFCVFPVANPIKPLNPQSGDMNSRRLNAQLTVERLAVRRYALYAVEVKCILNDTCI